jgi:uncharacterized membrane protein
MENTTNQKPANKLNGTGLNREANIGIIRKLYQDGLLSGKAFTAASAVLQPVSSWFLWARRMLLFFGSALVLAGIIFFFAYNWAAMGRFLKFGFIEAGIMGCILASHLRGRSRLSGKVLLLSSSVLVGVLLAVYGQTYQTGADAFELFIGWAVLILGWVIVSEFAALWLVWLILLNTGAILYWHQVGHPAQSIRYEFLCLALAVLNGAALALREVGMQKGLEWLSGRWLRGILLAALLVALSFPAIDFILDLDGRTGWNAFATFIWAITAAGGYICYRFKFRDMVPLALIVMNACVILLTLIGKILFHDIEVDNIGLFLFFALIILGVVSGAAFWLRKTALTMVDEIKRPA